MDEGWKRGGLSGEIIAVIIDGAFYELDAPAARVCNADVPVKLRTKTHRRNREGHSF